MLSILKSLFQPTCRTSSRKNRQQAILCVESLEDRLLLSGSPLPRPVPPPETDYFVITGAPAKVSAGTSFKVTVTEYAYATGKPAATLSGTTIPLTASDGGNSWNVGNVKLNGASGTGTVTLNVADTVEIFGSIGSLANPKTYVTGATGSIDVTTGPAAHFLVSVPATVTAGMPFTATLRATDAGGNTVTTYSGAPAFTTAGQQVIASSAIKWTNGVATVQLTLDKTGSFALKAAAGVATGTSNTLTVSPGALASFKMTAPSTVKAGTTFTVTVTPLDAYGNVVTNFDFYPYMTVNIAGSNKFVDASFGGYNPSGQFVLPVRLYEAGDVTLTFGQTWTTIMGAINIDVTGPSVSNQWYY